jgi:hypothetical protein
MEIGGCKMCVLEQTNKENDMTAQALVMNNMHNITINKVKRAERKVGKVVVKAQDFVSVEAWENGSFEKYSVNVHANGKIEFFIGSMYSCWENSLYGKGLIEIAKAV